MPPGVAGKPDVPRDLEEIVEGRRRDVDDLRCRIVDDQAIEQGHLAGDGGDIRCCRVIRQKSTERLLRIEIEGSRGTAVAKEEIREQARNQGAPDTRA